MQQEPQTKIKCLVCKTKMNALEGFDGTWSLRCPSCETKVVFDNLEAQDQICKEYYRVPNYYNNRGYF